MSRENVEVVQRWAEAFNRRDLDAFLELMDPDVEMVPILARIEGTEGNTYRGREAVRQWIADLDRDWAEFRTDPQEFRDLGDVVLTLGTWHARGRTSDVVLDSQPGAWVTRLRDGRVVRHETFTDRAEALEAVGLSE
jgi:uncharacterized protein (TIGR02246 family)